MKLLALPTLRSLALPSTFKVRALALPDSLLYTLHSVISSGSVSQPTRRGTRRAMASSAVTEGAEVTLETMKFVNRAIKSLPVEENRENYVRTVPG